MNPQPLYHETRALPSCYHRGPMPQVSDCFSFARSAREESIESREIPHKEPFKLIDSNLGQSFYEGFETGENVEIHIYCFFVEDWVLRSGTLIHHLASGVRYLSRGAKLF